MSVVKFCIQKRIPKLKINNKVYQADTLLKCFGMALGRPIHKNDTMPNMIKELKKSIEVNEKNSMYD